MRRNSGFLYNMQGLKSFTRQFYYLIKKKLCPKEFCITVSLFLSWKSKLEQFTLGSAISRSYSHGLLLKQLIRKKHHVKTVTLPCRSSCACFQLCFNQTQQIENKGWLKYTVTERCECCIYVRASISCGYLHSNIKDK